MIRNVKLYNDIREKNNLKRTKHIKIQSYNDYIKIGNILSFSENRIQSTKVLGKYITFRHNIYIEFESIPTPKKNVAQLINNYVLLHIVGIL